MAVKPVKKRPLEESSSATPKAKKTKVSGDAKEAKQTKEQSKKPAKEKGKEKAEKPLQPTSNLISEEVDFPRGGGTSFTPLEVKAIRAEGLKEAEEELFKDAENQRMKRKRKSDGKGKGKAKGDAKDSIRVEHLNYKRLIPGMKILGQVHSVQPLSLIISLPNQLFGHVPITHISYQLTKRLEALDEDADMSSAAGSDDSDDEEGPSTKSHIPELFEMFQPGQYVRTAVVIAHPAGSTDMGGLGHRARDEVEKASRRVELSLVPETVNAGVVKADLKPGFTLSAAVKSVEDHGYILELGVSGVSGFLSFEDAKKGRLESDAKLPVGQLVDACVSKMSKNGRTCTVSAAPASFASASVSEVSSVGSVLPGTLVQTLVTAIVPSGLNLQVLGFFEGTVDLYHLESGDPEANYTVGQKVKARVLYQTDATTPPRFALSLAKHVVLLRTKFMKREDEDAAVGLQEAFPVGTVLEAVKVIRVETERGLVVEVQDGVEGFAHISQTSDDHVPTLPPGSGPWKVGTIHRARVTGHVLLDGMLQLSLRASVLQQKFLQVADVQVGEVLKGTIKRLTDTALFVSLSGNVDGVIWPNHYADIALKHPQKRFKAGEGIKCRVLVVDPERQRIALTAKKTMVESNLPLVTSWDDVKVGLVTHAVIFRVAPKSLQVEFYNNLKAIVPIKEASELTPSSLADAFPIGKVVKVRIISTDVEEHRMVASIRQAATNFKPVNNDVNVVEVGQVVEGDIAEVHKDNALVILQPSQVRALISLSKLAQHRGISVAQLIASLKPGQSLVDVVVVSKNAEKGIAIVSTKIATKSSQEVKTHISWDTVQVGQIVGGRVLSHNRGGALIKLGAHTRGTLHPTDCCDDFDQGTPFPAVDSILKAIVIHVDKEKKHILLSTRSSRMSPIEAGPVTDREIREISELKPGESVRGFIKSVAEHGLFVSLGRNVDARIQIRELFDEYVKDWKSHFVANQLVKGRILSVDTEKKQAEMTFRSGERSSASALTLKLSDFHVGQKVEGHVKKVEDYGLFIAIDGSRLSGLCHKSELSDTKDADTSLALRSFGEGDAVKVMILSIDAEKRRISLGLKPSYFDEDDFLSAEDGADDDDDDGEDDVLGVVEDLVSNNEGQADADGLPEPSSDEDEDADESLSVDLPTSATQATLVVAGPSRTSLPVPTLRLEGGFQWSVDLALAAVEEVSYSSSDEGDGGEQTGHRKKRRRKEIEQDLTADMHTKTPESNADFERVLLGSPNSSYMWIQYMSFQLQLSEVDKARDIGRRALKIINFREEQEKLNVWVALLNLENVYGTDETLEVMFKEAARSNDSKTVHLRLAAILDQSEKHAKAEEQYKRTSKKFGHSSKVWTHFCEHYLRHGQPEDARKLLPRSLQSLEKRKHLKTISKFAQLEYKLGDPERGKTIFEGIVDSHPKRWDLWSIYLDMEAGQGDVQSIRHLFDRILSLKMTSHKAKAFFKKWLEFERNIGDAEGAEMVKQKAIAWTQRATGETQVS